LLLLFSHYSSADSFFNFSNTVSTGKITINGHDISNLQGIKGDGILTKKQYHVNNFSALDVKGTIDIDYTTGPASLEVIADKNILPIIQVKQKTNTLYISTKSPFSTQNRILIKLSSPNLSQGIFNGAVDVSLSNIHNHSLNLHVLGSTDLRVSGQVSELNLVVNGTGDVNAKTLIADYVKISSGGATDISVTAKKRLDIHQSGAGDIIFFGNPPIVNTRSSGLGDIEPGY